MFLLRRKRTQRADSHQDQLPKSSLVPYTGDLSIFRSENWVSMKVWLPERVDEILRQLADHEFVTRSNLIRNALFVYLYGQYAFAQMQADKDGFFYDDGIRFSRSVSRTPALGKNVMNYKVFVPARMRDDLKTLASEYGLTLSHFTREALISAFMGHQTLPERESILEEAHARPVDWPPEAEEAAPSPAEEYEE